MHNAQPPSPPPARSTRPWLWAICGFVVVALGMAAFLGLVVAASGASRGHNSGGWASFGDSVDPVGLVTLRGPIDDAAARRTLEDLWSLANQEDIRALVLRIDSPGGQVGPSQELYREIKRLSEESKKPVVASMASVAASGGFYASLGCDWVFANPGTLTASIGVILVSTHGPDLLDEARLEIATYKSGNLKDAGSFSRRPTNDDQAFFQDTIDDIFAQFKEDVKAARGLDDEGFAPVADGRVVSGRRALELKLIDELGGLAEASRKALALAGVERPAPRFVTPDDDVPPWVSALFQSAGRQLGAAFADALRTVTAGPGARIEYRAPLDGLR